MEILRKKLTREEFKAYLKDKQFGDVIPSKLVIHHTWRPTVSSWDGERTIDGLKRYYEGLGWSAGPHIFIAPDGIWLFTDIAKVGIHAGAGNATWERGGQELRGFWYKNATLKDYSIGIEVVGDYDEKTWEGEILQNSLCCISELKKCLNLENDDIQFHREFSPKSCPGNAISREWLENKLTQYEDKKLPEWGHDFKFSPEEAKKAMELGFLKQIDSETREIIAIGLVRVYERVQKEFAKKRRV